jgi:hypothetical protein
MQLETYGKNSETESLPKTHVLPFSCYSFKRFHRDKGMRRSSSHYTYLVLIVLGSIPESESVCPDRSVLCFS